MADPDTVRIIFVDDDPMLLASTRRQLHCALTNCDVAFFDSPFDALQAIQAQHVDIVFSDVRMPGMDGGEFLAQVAKVRPTALRFAWTGQTEGDQLDQVLRWAYQVFCKPCPTERLKDLVAAGSLWCRSMKSESDDYGSDGELCESKLKKLLSQFSDISMASTNSFSNSYESNPD